jgi:hypothetical protein
VSAADGVSVSVDVEVEPDVAFDVFTRELDAWWARGPRFRFLAPYGGTMTLEPGVGGRLLGGPCRRAWRDLSEEEIHRRAAEEEKKQKAAAGSA